MVQHIPAGALAALLLVLLSSPALAGESVDFSSAAGGTISYAGDTGPLAATGIAIDVATGTGTARNAGAHAVTGGALNFTTGRFVSVRGDTYTFGAGGTFTITGGVPDAGIPNGSVLLAGQLTGASVSVASGQVYRVTGRGANIPNPALTEYFGNTGTSFTLGQVSVHVSPTESCNPCDATSPFSGLASHTKVPHAPPNSAGPGWLVLLGSGLIGLVTLVRRRFQRAQ